jgi:hypothetical protein
MNVRLARLCSTLLPLTLCGCQCSSDGEETDASPVDSGEEDAGADGGSDACVWPEQPECPDVEIQPIDPACSKDGWCWVHPTPAGNGYRTLWDDGCTLYAGGEEGALAAVDLATGELSGFWNLFDDGTIDEMTGFPDGRLFFLVYYQTYQGLYSWDGENVEEWPMPDGGYELTLKDVEVDLNGDLYVTGEDYDEANNQWHAYFARWDGAGWERIETGLEHGLHEMAVEPCGGMYILAGRSHTLDDYPGGCGVFYWNGEELVQEFWRAADWNFEPCVLNDLDVGEDVAVWAAGEYDFVIRREEDGTWEQVFVPSPPGDDPWDDYKGVAIESDTSVVLAGKNAVYWNGVEWQEIWDHGMYVLNSYDGLYSNGAAWFVRSGGRITKVVQSSLSYEEIIEMDYITITEVWVSASNTVYLSGTKCFEEKPGIWKFSPFGALEEMPLPEIEAEYFRQIWGTSDEDIWAVGSGGTMLHYDYADWEIIASPVTIELHDIWGTSSDNIYIIGNNSTILHWNGAEIVQLYGPNQYIGYGGIWGSSDNDIYIAAFNALLHYNGVDWSNVAVPTDSDYFDDIVGRGPNDIYIMGSSHVWHFDGTELTVEYVGQYNYFTAIALHKTTGDIYVTSDGGLGAVLRLASGDWTEEDPGTFNPLYDIAFGDTVGFLAVGGLLSKQLY